jgi:hypothetical protein
VSALPDPAAAPDAGAEELGAAPGAPVVLGAEPWPDAPGELLLDAPVDPDWPLDCATATEIAVANSASAVMPLTVARMVLS